MDSNNFLETYTKEQTNAIAEEFKRLKGQYYLEHAGATLYSEKQMTEIHKQLSENIFANPHATNISSKNSEDLIDIIRFDILKYFKTNPIDYSVIFTSSASAALKIIAETFDYGENGYFTYLHDNHTSVLGMRSFAKQIDSISMNEAFKIFKKDTNPTCDNIENCNSLFVYPAQSNFSGMKYPLAWIKQTQQGALNSFFNTNSKWYVTLDAASFCGTNQLDLSQFPADFVTISFYKIFGYPTGLGALLVRNSSSNILVKKYYGGGTIFMTEATKNLVVMREILHERFEDGTLPFLSILALKQGFSTLKRLNLNMEIIQKHTFRLAQYVYRNLFSFKHFNGTSVVILYHGTSFDSEINQGAIVNFNILRDNGDYVGYSEVLNFANLYNIHLRTGCHCNPGACQYFLQLSSDQIKEHFNAGHVCGDQFDLINGQPTGTIRISFGYMSTKQDADKFLEMINDCFVIKETEKEIIGTLEKIIIYPVKSCSGFVVPTKWGLTPNGLKYDRQWMLISANGMCLTQKHLKKLCLIKPVIDLVAQVLILEYDGFTPISVPLEMTQLQIYEVALCDSKVCGDRIQGWDCGNEVSDWLTKVLDGLNVRLLKQAFDSRISKKNETVPLSLANKAQYLLINIKSVEWLRGQIPDFDESLDVTIQRFRANLLVSFRNEFLENQCQELVFGGTKFLSGGFCTRCQMICIDQTTGKATKEPLQTLSRLLKGKVCFGIYLNSSQYMEPFLQVGCTIGRIK